jgi:hypothetical protein
MAAHFYLLFFKLLVIVDVRLRHLLPFHLSQVDTFLLQHIINCYKVSAWRTRKDLIGTNVLTSGRRC